MKAVKATAAHQETTMGNTPAHTVTCSNNTRRLSDDCMNHHWAKLLFTAEHQCAQAPMLQHQERQVTYWVNLWNESTAAYVYTALGTGIQSTSRAAASLMQHVTSSVWGYAMRSMQGCACDLTKTDKKLHELGVVKL